MNEQKVHFFGKEMSPKKKKVIIGVILVIFFFVFIGAMGGDSASPSSEAPVVANNEGPEAKPQISKEDAQKELDELMGLAIKGGLIKSYDFSEIAPNVYRGDVYADKAWYTQTVQFKKDFLAKVAMLREGITGYKHFKVLDAYSNEKVAEVTAFSGSLEVYK
jgi:hypothetical protein